MRKTIAVASLMGFVTLVFAGLLTVGAASAGGTVPPPVFSGSAWLDTVGANVTVSYSAAECVDLDLYLEDDDGLPDDSFDILVNGCTVASGLTIVSTRLSLSPGDYEIVFLYTGFGYNEGSSVLYRGTEYPFTGDYVNQCVLETTCAAPEVMIDIKPGSDPNAVNRNAKGVIPVAILGSESFDVGAIDVTSLQFGPGHAPPVHDLLDGAVYTQHLQDVNADGWMDLVVHFSIQAAALAVGDTQATLYFDADVECGCDLTLQSVQIEASDSVLVRTK